MISILVLSYPPESWRWRLELYSCHLLSPKRPMNTCVCPYHVHIYSLRVGTSSSIMHKKLDLLSLYERGEQKPTRSLCKPIDLYCPCRGRSTQPHSSIMNILVDLKLISSQCVGYWDDQSHTRSSKAKDSPFDVYLHCPAIGFLYLWTSDSHIVRTPWDNNQRFRKRTKCSFEIVVLNVYHNYLMCLGYSYLKLCIYIGLDSKSLSL